MTPIIETRSLWKKYQIGGKKQSYLSLRERISDISLNPFNQKKDFFWAIKDLSFNVMQGECVGIIGRNGAGKSTLLKILSRITPPTKGEIKMRGRVASLLEVGTGFHPELTGRENVFLNGSILGMKKNEITSQFDAIVDFSGIESFLDTPLKHYSSGMQLRLAFSVAAYLNPEILLIDEVLAVGDAEFQKKCLGKMNEVSKSGRTVIFVSHDLGAVKQLCDKSILLDKGSIIAKGNTTEVIDLYTRDLMNKNEAALHDSNIIISKNLTLEQFSIIIDKHKLNISINVKGDISKIKSVVYIIAPSTQQRVSLVDLRNSLLPKISNTPSKEVYIQSSLDLSNYVDGLYQIGLGIETVEDGWYESDKIPFEILKDKLNGYFYESKYRGIIHTPSENNISLI